jgi:hypothetical protein
LLRSDECAGRVECRDGRPDAGSDAAGLSSNCFFLASDRPKRAIHKTAARATRRKTCNPAQENCDSTQEDTCSRHLGAMCRLLEQENAWQFTHTHIPRQRSRQENEARSISALPPHGVAQHRRGLQLDRAFVRSESATLGPADAARTELDDDEVHIQSVHTRSAGPHDATGARRILLRRHLHGS